MSIHAISPIDGRYSDKVAKLSEYFSEYALMKYRVKVEVEYLIALANVIPGLEGIAAHKDELLTIINEFNDADATAIKEIEKTTNHDVKAVEYYLREKLKSLGLDAYLEHIHFGLTSQDINNTAFPMMTQEAMIDIIMPMYTGVSALVKKFATDYPHQPMLAHTHGQPASPTTFKKEMTVFEERLEHQILQLKNHLYFGKFGGATGNFNAHLVAYPNINWEDFAVQFLKTLGLNRLITTTQISHYDAEAMLFHNLMRANTILIDLCRDIWTYISMEYIKQKPIKDEVGSSAMPHKVNPIDFENAEGNLMYANSMFGFLADKLPISRLQRDLTDSTVLRNIGVPIAHTLIALKSIEKGMAKLSVNKEKLMQDLEANTIVIAEALQSILRREKVQHPYELLKQFTRGRSKMTHDDFIEFIKTLPVSENVKKEMMSITASNYVGLAD